MLVYHSVHAIGIKGILDQNHLRQAWSFKLKGEVSWKQGGEGIFSSFWGVDLPIFRLVAQIWIFRLNMQDHGWIGNGLKISAKSLCQFFRFNFQWIFEAHYNESLGTIRFNFEAISNEQDLFTVWAAIIFKHVTYRYKYFIKILNYQYKKDISICTRQAFFFNFRQTLCII